MNLPLENIISQDLGCGPDKYDSIIPEGFAFVWNTNKASFKYCNKVAILRNTISQKYSNAKKANNKDLPKFTYYHVLADSTVT